MGLTSNVGARDGFDAKLSRPHLHSTATIYSKKYRHQNRYQLIRSRNQSDCEECIRFVLCCHGRGRVPIQVLTLQTDNLTEHQLRAVRDLIPVLPSCCIRSEGERIARDAPIGSFKIQKLRQCKNGARAAADKMAMRWNQISTCLDLPRKRRGRRRHGGFVFCSALQR